MTSLMATPQPAVIFDLDGTLLDTEPLYTDAIQKVLDPHGHVYSMALKKKCMGGDSRRSAQLTIDEYGLPHSIDEFLGEREIYLREIFPSSPEIDGAGEFLDRLHEFGVAIGLATSSHQHLCDLKLTNKPWRARFSAKLCGNDPRVKNGKPAPDIFEACAAAIGHAPENCIAFEDSPTGIKAARAAGMRVIAVNSPYVELSDLHEAEEIINDYHELISLIRGW